MNDLVANPFGGQERALSTATETESARAVAEVQAAMVVAQRFPRNQQKAMDKILAACTRPSLAERALYSYARGGSDITGPSIRLAEEMARSWGNIQFGFRELESKPDQSTVEAWAWDLETNTRPTLVFVVKHSRSTKAKGITRLEDPRDVYENMANQAARRIRACLLKLIPSDVVDAAVEQVEATLNTKEQVTPERVKAMVEAFAELGVSRPMIEARIQRRIDAMTPQLMVQLRKIYSSLCDGMGAVGDWFDLSTEETAKVAKAEAKAKLQQVKKVEDAPPEVPKDPPQEPLPPVTNPNDIQSFVARCKALGSIRKGMFWRTTMNSLDLDNLSEDAVEKLLPYLAKVEANDESGFVPGGVL
jgi:hypothetical protein